MLFNVTFNCMLAPFLRIRFPPSISYLFPVGEEVRELVFM